MGEIVQKSSHTFSIGEPPEHSEEGRPWYDTKEGIIESIGSLEDLRKLEKARYEAAYGRGERLNIFHILGKWQLDTCGNFMKCSIDLKLLMPDMPDVQTNEEYRVYCRENWPKDRSSMIGYQSDSNLPPTDLMCPHCGKGWIIENCFDVIMHQNSKTISLSKFVGKTLADVQTHYSAISDAVYRIGSDIVIRNDANIDNSPKYPNPEEDWQQDIVKNENGWLRVSSGITEDYVVKEGDECYFNVWTLFHKECNEEHLAASEEKRFSETFKAAGFKNVTLEAIKNQYCGCDYCAPWFKIQTEFGNFTIGWRKRVINIDWSEVDPKNEAHLVSLFSKENTTKGSSGIHAHGWDKAQEYLSLICKKLAA